MIKQKKEMETRVSLLRRYLQEFAILALAGSVSYLFYEVKNLNEFIRNDLKHINERTIQTMNEVNYYHKINNEK